MKHYLLLLRPSNFAITVASIYVSCLLAGGTTEQFVPMVMASLAGGLIGAGGMVINDIFDIEIDRINKPSRPLPSGAVTIHRAVVIYLLLSLGGVAMNIATSLPALSIAAAAVPLIFLYSYKLKSTQLYGNLLVGFLTGLAFIYGGAAVQNISRSLIPALFAFLINVGREIVKDMEDVEGDARQGAVTFPVKHGLHRSSLLATSFLAAVILSTVYPYIAGIYGIRYFVLVNIGVNLVLVYVVISLWKNQTTKNLSRLSIILKYDMLIGLAAIYVG